MIINLKLQLTNQNKMINIVPLMMQQLKLAFKIHKKLQLLLKIIPTIMQVQIYNHFKMVNILNKNPKEIILRFFHWESILLITQLNQLNK